MITSGPDGEFWESDDQGNAFLTEEGLAWLTDGHSSFQDFELSTGEKIEYWNTPWIIWNGTLCSYGDGEGNKRCCYTTAWTEMNEISTDNELYHQWQDTVGYETWADWLAAENAFADTSKLDYISSFTSLPDDMMQLTVDAIRDKVSNASWQMVYAEDQGTFDTLWDQMIADCEGLGAQDIIDWRLADIENAIKIRDSLQA